jgi:hypothetical protein
VATGDSGCEAYTAIARGMGLSHERSDIAGAESFYSLEGNMCGTVKRGAVALPGSKATSRAKGGRQRDRIWGLVWAKSPSHPSKAIAGPRLHDTKSRLERVRPNGMGPLPYRAAAGVTKRAVGERPGGWARTIGAFLSVRKATAGHQGRQFLLVAVILRF